MASRAYTRGWKQLCEAAFALYGRQCHLKLEGCTHYADTVDHLDPAVLHGTHLPTLDRVRPACKHCNYSEGARLRNALHSGHPITPHAEPAPSRDWTKPQG